ncbi:MAG: prolipoprotein diacylglyceryl transferase [Clostridia bacterium]|nr:prolipoprotein diacylglyceryl transferase [Clostridia bacterium]
MIPNITIGAQTISAYLICTLIGAFAAGILTIRKTDKDYDMEWLTVLLWSAPGLIIGGHLLYAITNLTNIIAAIKAGAGWFTVLSYFSGNVFYGGMIGGLLSAVIYCKIAHIDYRKYTNNGALFIPLFHVFGRIGCFLSGCCFGMECSVGFVYKYSLIESANHVRRFPIQLVEAAGNLIIFLVLYHLFNKNKKNLLSLYFVLYSILRFTTEFFRGDDYRGFLFSLSTSQIISVILLIAGVVSLAAAYKKRHSKPQNQV